jgi:hypothetical protein
MSRKKTLQSSDCDHITKIISWSYKLVDGDVKSMVELYGCTNCDETSNEPFISDTFNTIDHTKCGGPYECFGCKAKGLQLNSGDASRDIPDRKWTGELKAYRDAKAQGMQPGGTTRAHVEAAYSASETLGKAYNSETMPKAHQINKKTAEVMKEIGQV